MRGQDLSWILIEFLQKNTSDFLNLSVLKKIPKRNREKLGLTSRSSPGEIERKITPSLGNTLTILKGSRCRYLAYAIPKNEILYNYIKKHPGRTPGQVAPVLPMPKHDFIKELNFLIRNGAVYCIYTEDYKTRLHVISPAVPLIEAPRLDDITLFKEKFHELDRGIIFVRICDLRRKLGWSQLKFDSVLEKLRDTSVIQLHSGDISTMDEDEIRDSYLDENNFLHITMTWREK